MRPQIDIDGGGTIWIGAKEPARYDADIESWKRKAGWNEFEKHWSMVWEKVTDKYEQASAATA